MTILGSEIIDRACVGLIQSVDNTGATIHNNPATQLANGVKFPVWWIVTRSQKLEEEVGKFCIFEEEKELYYYLSKEQTDPRIYDKYRDMQFKILEGDDFLHTAEGDNIRMYDKSYEVSSACFRFSFRVKFRVRRDVLRNFMQSANINIEVKK